MCLNYVNYDIIFYRSTCLRQFPMLKNTYVFMIRGGVMIIAVFVLFAIIFALLLYLIILKKNFDLMSNKYKNTLYINETLLQISKETTNFKDIDELYQKLLEYTIKLIDGAELGSILIYNRKENHMDYKALKGYSMDLLKDIHLKKEELFQYKINKLEKPVIIIDPMKYDETVLSGTKFKTLKNSDALISKCLISAPLYVDEEFWGCISVDNAERYDAFSSKDIEMLEFIVSHLEIAIKNSLLVDNMKKLIITDSLTGLYNRRYYSDYVSSRLENGLVPQGTAFIMIDMDNFKLINDKHGHAMGDEILRHFSRLLKSKFRRLDSIIRLSGDEFLIILFECNEENAVRIINNIEQELNNNPYKGIYIKFSYGISVSEEGMNAEELKKRADKNMYFLKSSKKK